MRGSRTYLTYCGETRSIAEWAEICDLKPKTMLCRMARGYTPEQILAPVKQKVEREYVSTLKRQPCWTCARACGHCAWSRKENPQPIPGWIATPTEVSVSKGKKQRSNRILWCPEWKSDGRKEST